MHSSLIKPSVQSQKAALNSILTKAPNYTEAECQFTTLLAVENLDNNLESYSYIKESFEATLAAALTVAYYDSYKAESAHLFLQRVLYRINRLKLFWYDDLTHYQNERSLYLQSIQHRIEDAWQAWELSQLNVEQLKQLDVHQALSDRAAADLEPEPSATGRYLSHEMTEAGYRRVLEIASLDGLVEASQLSRTLGGVANEVSSVLTRLMIEEYGAGKLSRKHSTYFTTMLSELGMNTEPEAYLDQVPWEVLATINHSFLLSERKRFFLRYVGGLLYTEISVPSSFSPYQAAGERLGLSKEAIAYWSLHIKVDILHGRWMLDEVALPLVNQYPVNAWELVLGYDQQKWMGDRAGEAVVLAARRAER